MMKYIYILLLSLCYTSVFASMFCSQDDAEKGLAAGTGLSEPYKFTRSVGEISIAYDSGKTHSSSAILITPQKALCSGHMLDDGPYKGSINFHNNTQEAVDVLMKCKEEGRDVEEAMLTVGTEEIPLKRLMADLNLGSIVRHPKYDVAIVELMTPLETIPLLPLVLERPLSLPPHFYLVSYSFVTLPKVTEPIAKSKRHLSRMDNIRDTFLGITDAVPPFCYVRDFDIDRQALSYRLEEKVPPLFAYPGPGVSGAPLINPVLSEFGVVGIGCGLKFYATENTKDGNTKACFAIIPLYAIKKWLQTQRPTT